MASPFDPCVIIPVYNHEGPLPTIVERLLAAKLPCILVDDGSRASCAELIAGLAARHAGVQSLRLETNQGKGAAVKAGLRRALACGHTHAVQIDADGQHDLKDLDTFLAAARQVPEAVIVGQPVFDRSIPTLRFYARYLTHLWVWINTLSLAIRDSMCGFRVYPLEACAKLMQAHALEDRMAFDVEILVRLYWQGVAVVSIPTRVSYPQDGLSHFRGFEDNLRISLTHARLFFGMLPRLPVLLARHFPAPPGTELRHWASLEETSLLWGIRALVWSYRVFGRRGFRLFLRPVVSYYFLTGRIARQASMDYLRRLSLFFPELGCNGGWLDSYRHFLSFGEALLDKIVVWSGRIDPSQVEFRNRGLLLDLLEQKRGALVLSGHIGNLEICRALANLRGHIRLNILVHTKHAEKFNRLLGGADADTIRLIQVTELNPAVAILLQEKVERGEFVVMVGDRTPVQGSRTVRASFLGEEAEFPQGPYLLASLLRCPVYTLFCFAKDGRYQIHFEPFAESIRIPRAEPQRTEALTGLARRYAERLESFCRAAPLQWFNFYPYWAKPSKAARLEENAP